MDIVIKDRFTCNKKLKNFAKFFPFITGPYWEQGYFYCGNKKRISTLTDVKFITNNYIVVAHRASASISLFEIKGTDAKLQDRISIFSLKHKIIKKYLHPDLIYLNDNFLYISSFTNKIAQVTIKNKRLKLNKILKFGKEKFHGISMINNKLILPGVHSEKITTLDIKTNQVNYLILKIKKPQRRVKTISIKNDVFFISTDTWYSRELGAIGDSWLSIFSLNGTDLIEQENIFLPNSQVDGSLFTKDFILVSVHSADDNCGYILTLKFKPKLKLIKKTKCHPFPHGMDVSNNHLAYTSYSTSSVHVKSLSNYLI